MGGTIPQASSSQLNIYKNLAKIELEIASQ